MSRTRLRIEEMSVAERFIDRVGFCSALTDARRAGPSMYVAVCGRRDAYVPRNAQEDPEAQLAWAIKDELTRLGEVYYGSLKGGRATFIAPRLIPHFNALFGVPAGEESSVLSPLVLRILKVVRRERERGTSELRLASSATYGRVVH